ncbi:MAG: hypothetical protein ACLR23_21120 [Clostridia bacterium]
MRAWRSERRLFAAGWLLRRIRFLCGAVRPGHRGTGGADCKSSEAVPFIEPDPAVRELAANFAAQAGTEGNRCEIILIRTAAAIAAYEGREYINAQDIKEAAEYVMPHRRRADLGEALMSRAFGATGTGKSPAAGAIPG